MVLKTCGRTAAHVTVREAGVLVGWQLFQRRGSFHGVFFGFVLCPYRVRWLTPFSQVGCVFALVPCFPAQFFGACASARNSSNPAFNDKRISH